MRPSSAIKYPRTVHLPWSPGRSDDDLGLASLDVFLGREVVVTEKMDGENTSLYRDGLHARSLDSVHHPSRSWLKGFHRSFAHRIPEGWRLCGENCYARHAIHYDRLPSWFLLFSVWNEQNEALSWDETVAVAEDLGLVMTTLLWRGTWNEAEIRAIGDRLDPDRQEGFVVRLSSAIRYQDFATSVAKWVRPGHVSNETHWMHAPVVTNGLATAPTEP